jgi:PhnB protein
MLGFQPYLNFDGQTREAMTFYHQCLGGEFFIQSFGEANVPTPAGSEDRVMHAAVKNGNALLMASDTMPGMTFTKGNNVHVNVACESLEEIERLFKALGDGVNVVMPLEDQFWGDRFGMLIDRFGVNWMFSYHLPKS